MNKSYCDEMWENLAPFLTECIFVGYTIRERRGKQTYEDSPAPPPPPPPPPSFFFGWMGDCAKFDVLFHFSDIFRGIDKQHQVVMS